MVSPKFDFAKKSAFLLADAPPAPKKLLSTRFPSINHILVYSYAEALDSLLDFTDPDKDAKVVSTLYVKLFAHTAKHMIHKYNRHKSGEFRFKIWGYYDFMQKQGKNYSYVEYPRTEDLCSLKREVMNRTPIKVKSEEMDRALQNINENSSNDFKDYYLGEFQPDFEQAHLFWTVMINFMSTVKESQEKLENN
jgi:hypothetical protein